MSPEGPIFLEGVLARVSGGDPTFEGEVLDLFLSTALELAGAMEDAHRGKDMETLVMAAHTLKGNASSIGAVALARVCTDLEHEAGRPDGLPGEVLPQVANQLALLRSHLRDVGRLGS